MLIIGYTDIYNVTASFLGSFFPTTNCVIVLHHGRRFIGRYKPSKGGYGNRFSRLLLDRAASVRVSRDHIAVEHIVLLRAALIFRCCCARRVQSKAKGSQLASRHLGGIY